MKLLVTGGAGFIGSNYVLNRFEKAGKKGTDLLVFDLLTYAANPAFLTPVANKTGYRFVKGDIGDTAAVETAFKTFKPDAVVHFAAESHVDRSIESGLRFVETNVMGTQVLLDAARRHDVKRFIHVSTDEVYGSTLDEGFVETDPLEPSSPYSASKAGSDLLALSHHVTYGLPVLVTRCTNNFGPHQHEEKLLPKVIRRALANEKIPVYGTGKNVRDWLFVRDHCDAIDLLLEKGKPGEIYNIAAQDERTNLDVIRYLLKVLRRPESLIEFVKDRPGHDFRYSLDDTKLRGLGWKPKVKFEQGIATTVDWVRGAAPKVKA